MGLLLTVAFLLAQNQLNRRNCGTRQKGKVTMKQRCMICDHGVTAHDTFGCAYQIAALDEFRTIVGSKSCPCSMTHNEIRAGWDHRAVQIAVNAGA